MKEKDFLKKCPRAKSGMGIKIYYGINNKGEVFIDEDSMREEFNEKLKEVIDFSNKDELQLIVKEKLKNIKEKKNGVSKRLF